MPRCFCLTLAVIIAGAGSNFALGQAPSDDSALHLKQAQQDLDNNKPAEAADEYEAALAANPKLPEAEYELGVLYGEKLHDPVSSIYHLKRFRLLAPSSEKAPNAQQLIDKESKVFASTVPTDDSDAMTKLQAENALQKKQLDDASHTITLLQGQLAQAAKTSPSAAPLAGEAAAPTPPGPQKALPLDQINPNVPVPGAPLATGTAAAPGTGGRSYTVVKGDKLWTIAHKMYPGHTKEGVEKIEGANPGVTSKLKIGQTLTIPD
jgi:phage tail protein X